MSEEERHRLIKESLQELISCFIDKKDDGKYRALEHFAWHQIQNHRFSSVNGHNTNRNIAALAERFAVENMSDVSDYLKKLCDYIIKHPLCVDHYVYDINYGVIEFLLSLAYQPIKAARNNPDLKDLIARNPFKELNDSSNDTSTAINEINTLELIKSLKEDFIPSKSYNSDSSERSENEESAEEDYKIIVHLPKEKKPVLKPPKPSSIKSPEKQFEYKPYENTNQLAESVQQGWWNPDIHLYTETHNRSLLANYAIVHVQYSHLVKGIMLPTPSTTTEYCLLREIIMMFFEPATCKYFLFDNDTIKLQPNVTITSVKVEVIQMYLEANILPYINMMYEIKQLLNSINNSATLPRTLENFVFDVQEFLQPVRDKLVMYDVRLIEQNDGDLNTLINFFMFMKDSFRTLEFIHSLCTKTLIMNNDMASHVKSAYLLAQLYEYGRITHDRRVIVLFMTTLKSYCTIVDTWWHRESLDDWKNEFICECTYNAEEMIKLRPLNASEIGQEVVDIIQNCPFYNMLSTHMEQSGDVLSMLREAELFDEFLENFNGKKKLYEEMVDDTVEHFKKFLPDHIEQCENKNSEETKEQIPQEQLDQTMVQTKELQIEELIKQIELAESKEQNQQIQLNESKEQTPQGQNTASKEPTAVEILMPVKHRKNKKKKKHHDNIAPAPEELELKYTDSDTAFQAKVESAINFAKNNGGSMECLSSELNFESGNTSIFDVFKNLTATKDEHLLGAFYMDVAEFELEMKNNKTLNATQLLELFNKVLFLPNLYKISCTKLNEILMKRIYLANTYVVKLYLERFRISTHIQHIRDIMLMEANYAMYGFYSKLFEEIESHNEWGNSSLLTMQLNDIVSLSFPELASTIRIKVTSIMGTRTDKVYQAVDSFAMTYNLSPALARVITPEHIKKYNLIMSLVLKVKWCVWKLQKLRFSRRNVQDPFGELKLIDVLMRRLEQLRLWVYHVINCLHSYIYADVILPLGKKFEGQLKYCTNLHDLYELHDQYLKKLCQHCLVSSDLSRIYDALDQLFHLIYVLNMEWLSCTNYIEESNALSMDISLSDSSASGSESDYLANNQLDEIEQTYIRCHQLLADILQKEVHENEMEFLAYLEMDINGSVPY